MREAYSNLGVLLQLMGKSTEAIAAYRTATRLNPRYGLAHFNLGGTLKDLERLEEAIGAFRQAIACEPDLAPARFQLCNVRLHACDWRGLRKGERRLPREPAPGRRARFAIPDPGDECRPRGSSRAHAPVGARTGCRAS